MSTFKRNALSRRTFLRGAGVTLALPFLEAMLPRTLAAQTMGVPKRMLIYYVPNGMHMPAWTPDGVGANWTPKSILEPLAGLRDYVSILSGIENQAGWSMGDGPGDHARGTGTFLSAVRIRKTNGADIRNGITVDQVAANAFKDETKFASLQLGMDGGGSTGDCDSGYSCAYARNVSWADEVTPLPKLTDTQQVFDYLFGGFDPNQSADAVRKRKLYRKSVLDYVKRDTDALQKQLGASDKIKLEGYLDGVRELERRVDNDDQGPACTPPEAAGAPTRFADKARAMADLMAAAFECDLTRVITFMLANAGSGRNYQSEPGVMVSGNHHQISHHENKQENYDKLMAIDRWEVEQFAYLLERLQGKMDVDGNSVLHNSILFFSSEISDGNRHNHDDLPVLLAGNAGGFIQQGRHLRFDQDIPVSNLFTTMLQSVGLNVSNFGVDSTGAIDQLKSS